MRVTTGIARGMNLLAPPDSDVTRPTSDMTKQAMFNIVQFEVEGAEVLDLFAGSGWESRRSAGVRSSPLLLTAAVKPRR